MELQEFHFFIGRSINVYALILFCVNWILAYVVMMTRINSFRETGDSMTQSKNNSSQRPPRLSLGFALAFTRSNTKLYSKTKSYCPNTIKQSLRFEQILSFRNKQRALFIAQLFVLFAIIRKL